MWTQQVASLSQYIDLILRLHFFKLRALPEFYFAIIIDVYKVH